MGKLICILEDDADRERQFRAVASVVAPQLEVRVWSSARAMIADLLDCLEHAAVISLDHDLNPLVGDLDDPGCGYDVVKVLEQLVPCCPVIIHTSNVERGTWMEGALSMAGWTYERVAPFGDQWIEKDWGPLVRKLLETPGA